MEGSINDCLIIFEGESAICGPTLVSRITGNLSFRAFGPRNFMKAQCSKGPFPATKPFVFSSALIANIVLSTLGTGTHFSGYGVNRPSRTFATTLCMIEYFI
jgi:hypothetical protein